MKAFTYDKNGLFWRLWLVEWTACDKISPYLYIYISNFPGWFWHHLSFESHIVGQTGYLPHIILTGAINEEYYRDTLDQQRMRTLNCRYVLSGEIGNVLVLYYCSKGTVRSESKKLVLSKVLGRKSSCLRAKTKSIQDPRRTYKFI
jgi:hypothetical protein